MQVQQILKSKGTDSVVTVKPGTSVIDAARMTTSRFSKVRKVGVVAAPTRTRRTIAPMMIIELRRLRKRASASVSGKSSDGTPALRIRAITTLLPLLLLSRDG